MKIRLWRGFHSTELLNEIRHSWESGELLVLCPPYLDQFEFCRHLPPGPISLIGDWHSVSLPAWVSETRADVYRESPVLAVFTSGTVSGQPRLVLYSKANIISSIEAIFALFDTTRIKTIFCYAQPFHTFGLLLGYVLSLRIGARLFTPDGKYTKAAHAKRLAIRDPDLLTLGTPAHFFDLVEVVRQQGGEIAPSYSCIMGGASVSVELWKKAQSVLRIEAPSIGYGCSEASPGITHLPPGQMPTEDSEIGFPLGNLQSEFAADAVSIQGPSLCLGVINASGINFAKKRLIRDTIRRREDGALVFQGRSDLVMNRGGEKISLERLESSVFQALGIEVMAVPMPDSRLGQDLGLVIKFSGPRSDSAESEQVIKTTCLRHLQDFFSHTHRLRLNPDRCAFVVELPRNSSFKPNRQEALELLQGERSRKSEDCAR